MSEKPAEDGRPTVEAPQDAPGTGSKVTGGKNQSAARRVATTTMTIQQPFVVVAGGEEVVGYKTLAEVTFSVPNFRRLARTEADLRKAIAEAWTGEDPPKQKEVGELMGGISDRWVRRLARSAGGWSAVLESVRREKTEQ